MADGKIGPATMQTKFSARKLSGTEYKCGVYGCEEQATFLVTDVYEDGARGGQCAYCDAHYGRQILTIDRVEIFEE